MSKYYNQLLYCEKRLRKTFITNTVINNPTTITSQYKLQSYRLLSHAEIEFYIETLLLSKVKIEKKKFDQHGIISNCISHLFAYNKCDLPGTASRLTEISSKNDIEYRINRVVNNYEILVKRNNGIKEVDIIPLLVQVGIDYTQINQTLLNNLSSYGKYRGDTAHNSTKIQQLINPRDEIEIVQQIISELNSIDLLVSKVK